MKTLIFKNGKLFFSETWEDTETAELYGEYYVTVKQKQEPECSWAWITE